MNPLILIAIGVLTGVYSGIMGLGGGTLMIPIMVFLLHFSQHEATGTSLAAMLPPVTILAVREYYLRGQVKLGTAGWIALGIVFGALLGGMLAGRLPERAMKLIFGFVLIYVGANTCFTALWGREQMLRAMGLSGLLLGVAAALYLGARAAWAQ